MHENVKEMAKAGNDQRRNEYIKYEDGIMFLIKMYLRIGGRSMKGRYMKYYRMKKVNVY